MGVTYYPAEQLEGDHVIAVGFPCDTDWFPTAEYAKELRAKRGHLVALVRQEHTIRSFWQCLISGSNELRRVPNWDYGDFEILRVWKWYARAKEWREQQQPEMIEAGCTSCGLVLAC